MAFCLSCYFLFKWVRVGVVTEVFHIRLPQLSVYSHQYHQQIIDLHMVSGDSIAHRHPHGLRPESAHAMTLSMLSGGSTDHHINMAHCYSRTMDLDMALGGSTELNITKASGGSIGHSH